MVNQLLVSLVNSVLGSGKPTARGNYAYHCPFCNHHKPKLEVQLLENKEGQNRWACWACMKKGNSIYSLFKQVKTDQSKLDEVKKLVKSSYNSIKDYIQTSSVSLPKEFKPLTNTFNTFETRHVSHYLKSRGITHSDIIKYNIGYCDSGEYNNMIILPAYNEEGTLNFFTGRSIEKDPYIKYKNPSVSRNITPNAHLINWSLPVILCEGIFDAIAIKRNVIPLLGKNIQQDLMKKLIRPQVKEIYIALDKDAMDQSITHCENLLSEGKTVYLVDLDDKDPSDMGFEKFTALLKSTQPLTYSKLLELKLKTC